MKKIERIADVLSKYRKMQETEAEDEAKKKDADSEEPEKDTDDASDSMSTFMNKEGESNWREVKKGDVDKEQLEMGIEVEMEHTSDKKIAEKIALDHLAEYSDYYTHLADAEAKMTPTKGSEEPTEEPEPEEEPAAEEPTVEPEELPAEEPAEEPGMEQV